MSCMAVTSTSTTNVANSKVVNKLYFDYNATTPLAIEVISEIQNAMIKCWGNPSSSHEEGALAKHALQRARNQVSSMIGAPASDIIFLSGGTEANNLVIHSAFASYMEWYLKLVANSKEEHATDETNDRKARPHIITTNLEHDSILLPLKKQYSAMAEVTYLDLHNLCSMDTVLEKVRPNTCLISVMLANNETGIILSISEITKCIRDLNRKRVSQGLFRILLHTDAAQAVGKVPVDVNHLNVDYLTLVGHKYYGPRIGALYVRHLGVENDLHPMIFGGNQEGGYRAGTENIPQIVGLGVASALVTSNLTTYQSHMTNVRDYMEERLKELFGKWMKINCGNDMPCNVNDPQACSISNNSISDGSEGPEHVVTFPRLPNTSSVSFNYPEVTGASILANCEYLRASTGAACHSADACSGNSTGSGVLAASGVCSFHAARTIRLSIGRDTTTSLVDLALDDLKNAVDKIIKKEAVNNDT